MCHDDPALHIHSQHQSLIPSLLLPKNIPVIEKIFLVALSYQESLGSNLDFLIIHINTHDRNKITAYLWGLGIFQGVELSCCNLLQWTESVESDSFPQFSVYRLASPMWRKSSPRRAVIFSFPLYYLYLILAWSPELYLGHQELRRGVIATSWCRTWYKCYLWRLLRGLIGEVIWIVKWFARIHLSADN